MVRLALPPYAASLVEEVRSRSGYPIQIVEEDAVGFDSQLRLAHAGSPVHEVTFSPEYQDYAVHFLVSGARKVLRLYACPPDERYVAALTAWRRLPVNQEAELRLNFGPRLDERGVRAVSQFLFEGAVRQLTSVPVDLRVERELYEDLPAHRPLQHAYMKQQVEDIEPHFSAEVEGSAPSGIYAVTTAMNVVLAEESAEIAGTAIGPLVRSHHHRWMGTRLRQILRETKESGYAGDLLITDAWAKELGMRDWYEWVPLASA